LAGAWKFIIIFNLSFVLLRFFPISSLLTLFKAVHWHFIVL